MSPGGQCPLLFTPAELVVLYGKFSFSITKKHFHRLLLEPMEGLPKFLNNITFLKKILKSQFTLAFCCRETSPRKQRQRSYFL